ncbi:hypothetical protein PLICRDRAFT_180817 [Plicaturopsis crispa FD-325 SS-3]|uniref:Uncharacterized protein n=1 Tax=Plicaturopsis crispa FD-325 SS-3 TaxID=944288 RepID=A0A0C9T4H4_PLICR|nr:hypothetical protein PLICRDRAFT_180817 [Plicaturopsis crispa FD-325 SS-3]
MPPLAGRATHTAGEGILLSATPVPRTARVTVRNPIGKSSERRTSGQVVADPAIPPSKSAPSAGCWLMTHAPDRQRMALTERTTDVCASCGEHGRTLLRCVKCSNAVCVDRGLLGCIDSSSLSTADTKTFQCPRCYSRSNSVLPYLISRPSVVRYNHKNSLPSLISFTVSLPTPVHTYPRDMWQLHLLQVYHHQLGDLLQIQADLQKHATNASTVRKAMTPVAQFLSSPSSPVFVMLLETHADPANGKLMAWDQASLLDFSSPADIVRRYLGKEVCTALAADPRRRRILILISCGFVVEFPDTFASLSSLVSSNLFSDIIAFGGLRIGAHQVLPALLTTLEQISQSKDVWATLVRSFAGSSDVVGSQLPLVHISPTSTRALIYSVPPTSVWGLVPVCTADCSGGAGDVLALNWDKQCPLAPLAVPSLSPFGLHSASPRVLGFSRGCTARDLALHVLVPMHVLLVRAWLHRAVLPVDGNGRRPISRWSPSFPGTSVSSTPGPTAR